MSSDLLNILDDLSERIDVKRIKIENSIEKMELDIVQNDQVRKRALLSKCKEALSDMKTKDEENIEIKTQEVYKEWSPPPRIE